MKTIKGLILVFLVLFLVSCSSEPDGNDEGDTDPDGSLFYITGVQKSQLTSSHVKITWTTSKESTCSVYYDTGYLCTIKANSSDIITDDNKNFAIELSLNENQKYYYKIKAVQKSDSSKTAESSVNYFITPSVISAIIISDISVAGISPCEVSVSFQTDGKALCTLEYGADTAYGSSVSVDTSNGTDHSVSLDSLDPGSTFHYRIYAEANEDGYSSVHSGDETFTTDERAEVQIVDYEPTALELSEGYMIDDKIYIKIFPDSDWVKIRCKTNVLMICPFHYGETTEYNQTLPDYIPDSELGVIVTVDPGATIHFQIELIPQDTCRYKTTFSQDYQFTND
ncbi:MAG: hypothetical protein GY754_25060 [bacterium]|nr:hypothetical protein [bacterium]